MLNSNFIYLGVLVSILGTTIYIKATLKGEIKPNKLSFLIVSFAPLIVYFSQISQGVGIQSLMALLSGLTPLSIFIASFYNKKAYWKLTTFDFICAGLSILGLIFWQITKIGNLAIAFSILADFLATLPIIVKSFKYPETEKALPWLAQSFIGGITLLTITDWRFEQFGFPLYFLISQFIIYAFTQFKIGKIKK